MAIIDQLDELAHANGYESMHQATEAIGVSPEIDDRYRDALNRAIGDYVLAQGDPGTEDRTRHAVANAMEAIHVGRDGLAEKVTAHWRNPERYRN